MDDILHDPIWCLASVCVVFVHTGTENGREEANGRVSNIKNHSHDIS